MDKAEVIERLNDIQNMRKSELHNMRQGTTTEVNMMRLILEIKSLRKTLEILALQGAKGE